MWRSLLNEWLVELQRIKKDMIKTGGENVASREVDKAIYQMDEVAEVVVFEVDHPVWIEAVTAVVVHKTGATLRPEAVITFARSVLAPTRHRNMSSSPTQCRKIPAARSSNANCGQTTVRSSAHHKTDTGPQTGKAVLPY